MEEASRQYLATLTGGRRQASVPAAVAGAVQRAVGNAAAAALVPDEAGKEGDAARDEEGPVIEDETREGPEQEKDEDEEEQILPEADEPAPADPADAPNTEDEARGAGDAPPAHEAQTSPGATAPSPSTGAGSGGGGGGGVSVASGGGGARAVVQAARQTANSMPQPATTAGQSRDQPQARPRRRMRRRQIAGPPPVPRVEADFATVRDPIEEQTRAIGEIAAQKLTPRRLPDLPPSPGENTVTLPVRPLSPEDRRLVSLGEEAMDRARLSREGQPPLPGESQGGETRARLTAIRNELLGVEPEQEEGETSGEGEQANASDQEAANAEEEAPDLFEVTPPDLPPADMTLAEQEMFTAVLADLKAGGRDAAERLLDRIKGGMRQYPGVLTDENQPALDNLGKNLLPDLQEAMDTRADGIAGVIGVAGSVLDTAVAERRSALETAAAEDGSTIRSNARIEVLSVEATAEARLADANAARQAGRDARNRAANVGEAPELGFRRIAEAGVSRIQAKVSEAIAGFQMQGRELKALLDLGKARWISALDLARLADQFDAERAAGLEPGRPHPANLSRSRRNAITAAINAATTWRSEQTRVITTRVDALKSQVDGEVAQKTRQVQDAGAAAFRALRDWGNAEDEANSAWWQEQVENLDTWAENAHNTAETWAQTESRLARMELQRAVQRARQQVEAEIVQNEDEKAAYQRLTEDQRRNFIARNILNSEQLKATVGRPMREAVFDAKKADVETKVEQQLFALPRGEWAALNAAAQAGNPGFDAQDRAGTIYSKGYDKVGTGESEIFQALTGLRTIERLAVTACYNNRRGSDNALYNDLDDELSGDEWRRAKDLMRGDQGAAAAEAIHDAVFGPGTGEAQIFAALEQINRLPPAERDRALRQADDTYQERYGESLSSRLRGDLSGSELGRALALAAGNMDEARAHEMNYALGSQDANAAAQVYGNIQSEVLAEARTGGWTRAEYQAAVVARNQAMEREFGRNYSQVANYNWGNGTTLEEAIGWNFVYDEGSRDRLRALREGDLVGASAGEMQAERRSFYADDEVMGNVVSRQFQIAAEAADLDIGYDLRNGVQRQVAAEVRRNPSMTAEDIRNMRMRLDRQVDRQIADAAFDRSRENVAVLDRRIQDRYGITLDRMIESTMSNNVFGPGGDLSNARARLEIMRRDANDPGAPDTRRLDWAYVRMRSGIEGAGTDVGELRSTMSGLTDREIQQLDSRWRRDHRGETLREAIQSDTSGRDEDDLVDLFDHGMPKTVAEEVDALRRKLDRDEESVGFLGAWESEDESHVSRRSLRELERLATQMRDPNLSPEQREHLTRRYDGQRLMVDNAIEAQRRAVDEFADIATTVIGYVVAAVVIIVSAVATVLSGGTASPALIGAIALAGSIVGTASSMVAKAAIKGGAYGLEEIGTDLAVGAVDLVVTMATMGLMKGGALFRNTAMLFRNAATEARLISQQAIRQGIRAGAAQTARTAARTAGREGVEQTLGRRALSAGREFAREQALDLAQGIPSTLAANVLNEDNWVHGNFAENMLRGTWEASLQNLRDGAIMSAGGRMVNAGAARSAHVPLTGRQRLDTNLRHWRHANPDASPADFARFIETQAAANSDHASLIRSAQREARRSLLSEIPPRERGAVADVPIIHVSGDQFRSFNRGNLGDAMVHVHNGQAVIIIREGASPSAVARIGPELRDVVAPGTRGRTVNPAESLPPRLRNRVEVDVVASDPTFGADEVRAVPQRDRDGNIVGVALQVGPNARAIDIQLHVDTVDAMRRYAGLAGEIRMFINRMGRRLGFDLIDPSNLARWEATLEVAKLPHIIDERVARLSEHGLDPRRKALVMEEIANLERQFMAEVARAEPGTAAEARGYVAAKAQGDLDTPPTRDSETTTATDAPELTPEQRRERLNDLARSIREQQTLLADADQALLDAQGESHSEAQNRIRHQRESYAQALEKLKPHLPTELHGLIDQARGWPPEVAANHVAIANHPEFAQALAQLGKRDQNTITRVGAYHEIIAQFHVDRVRIEGETRLAAETIEVLREAFRETGGKETLGVQRHADLPEPRSDAEYRPERAFEAKFRDKLGDETGSRLMKAIIDEIDTGYSSDLAAMMDDPELTALIAEKFDGKDLEKILSQVVAHREGYRAEIALASQVAGGIEGLPGDGTHTVVDYGDPIGANHADVVSVDAEGNVFLWDSKFRSEGAAGRHSETFSDKERRLTAAAEALEIIRDPSRSPNLSTEQRRAAERHLEQGTFFAITSHTDQTHNFRHETLRVVDEDIVPND